MNINIPGIDTNKAIQNSGSEEFFLELLGDVYKLMDEKINRVESSLMEGNIQNYTVEVHSLKTTCRMIGAMDLGEDFFTLEKLGKVNDIQQIKALTPGVLDSFKALKPYLEPFASSNNYPLNNYDKNEISTLLNKLVQAVNDYDLGSAEETTKQLASYECDEETAAKIETLQKLVSNLDYDEAKELALQLLGNL